MILMFYPRLFQLWAICFNNEPLLSEKSGACQ